MLLLSGGLRFRYPLHVAAAFRLGASAAISLVDLHALIVRDAGLQCRLDLATQAGVQRRIPCLGLDNRNGLQCGCTREGKRLWRGPSL